MCIQVWATWRIRFTGEFDNCNELCFCVWIGLWVSRVFAFLLDTCLKLLLSFLFKKMWTDWAFVGLFFFTHMDWLTEFVLNIEIVSAVRIAGAILCCLQWCFRASWMDLCSWMCCCLLKGPNWKLKFFNADRDWSCIQACMLKCCASSVLYKMC